MNRGDRREGIFKDDPDRERFLAAPGEVCLKKGWRKPQLEYRQEAQWLKKLRQQRLEPLGQRWVQTHALTYKVFRHLLGNIFGLTAHTARGKAFVSVYHSLPAELSLAQAQAITAERF